MQFCDSGLCISCMHWRLLQEYNHHYCHNVSMSVYYNSIARVSTERRSLLFTLEIKIHVATKQQSISPGSQPEHGYSA